MQELENNVFFEYLEEYDVKLYIENNYHKSTKETLEAIKQAVINDIEFLAELTGRKKTDLCHKWQVFVKHDLEPCGQQMVNHNLDVITDDDYFGYFIPITNYKRATNV